MAFRTMRLSWDSPTCLGAVTSLGKWGRWRGQRSTEAITERLVAICTYHVLTPLQDDSGRDRRGCEQASYKNPQGLCEAEVPKAASPKAERTSRSGGRINRYPFLGAEGWWTVLCCVLSGRQLSLTGSLIKEIY